MLLQIVMDPDKHGFAQLDLFLGKSLIKDTVHLRGHRHIIRLKLPGFLRQRKKRLPAVVRSRSSPDQSGSLHAVDHTGKGGGGKSGPVGYLPERNLLLLPQYIEDPSLGSVKCVDLPFGKDPFEDPVADLTDL